MWIFDILDTVMLMLKRDKQSALHDFDFGEVQHQGQDFS